MHDRDHHPKSELENQHPDSSRLSSSFLHGDEALIKAYMLSHFNTIRSLLQGAFYYISRNSMGRPTLWQCNIVFRRGDIAGFIAAYASPWRDIGAKSSKNTARGFY